jgi:LuxR family transcriptional regulator, maltose regulon positive regulatory protein
MEPSVCQPLCGVPNQIKKHYNVSVPVTLLQTKLYIPPFRLSIVPRPQLIERLNRGLQLGRDLTLVSAPAGFGKTTCIVEWLETLDLPVAWLSLDPADDDPGRFFTYLIAALQQIDKGLGRDIEGVLRAGQLPPGEIISTTLVNDILAIDGRFLLVLDDFQVIHDQFILQVFQILVTNMPQPCHLVLLTREEPSLPLARMRANDQMTEIRASDLRFTQRETALLLDQVMGIALSPSDRAALEDKTEGWIVGLQLAALSLRNRPDPSQFIATLSGSHRHILSYLTEEVLNQQPAEVQDFLLQTAVLDKLTGDLCDALTGGENGRLFLEQLYNDNLFLIPLDDRQQWFRYHQLFVDLLRDRLNALRPQETKMLHQRASRWYAQAGLPTEAIEHALAAADYETAISLIESYAMDLLMAWHAKTIKGWMRSLPTKWAARSPRTNLAFAWLYLPSGDFSQAQPYIERLHTMFAGQQLAAYDPIVQAEWLALQATLLSAQGQLDPSLELANRALSLLPPEDVHVRSLIFSGLAGAYKQMNDYPRAAQAYRELIEYGREAGSFVSEMMGISGLALYAMERGELHFAFELASQGVERVERSGILSPISAAVYGELGGVYYQWYQLDRAHPNFAKATQVSALSGYSDAEIYHHIIRSRLAQIEGDIERTVQEMRAAVDLNQIDAPAAVRDEFIAQQVRVLLAQDRLAAAEALLTLHGFNFQDEFAWPNLPPDQPLSRWHALLSTSALRIILHQAQVRKQPVQLPRGLELAERLIAVARQNHFLPVVAETLLIRAQLYAAQGNEPAGLADVTAALAVTEPEGVITLFLEGGPAIAQMLARLLEDGQLGVVEPDYVRQILAAFPEHADPDAATIARAPAANLAFVEPLSQRELEILGLIEAGLTNRQIAERLVVTLHTVKKHNSNIYAKLGVGSRTQAVAKARELELL